jgi:hypothetical protein
MGGSRIGSRQMILILVAAVFIVVTPGLAVTTEAQGVALPADVRLVQASPANPDVVYAVAGMQVYRSADRGSTWEQVGALASRIRSFAASLSDPDRVYAGTESLGLWRSLDGGRTWHENNNGLEAGPGTVTDVGALALDREDDMVLYAAVAIWLGTSQAHLTPTQVAFTIDGGNTWLPLKRMEPGDSPIVSLTAVEGLPFSVMAFNEEGNTAFYEADTRALLAIATSAGETPERRRAASEALSMLREQQDASAFQASNRLAPATPMKIVRAATAQQSCSDQG